MLMGSANDAQKIQPAIDTLTAFCVEHEWWEASAHRNAGKVAELSPGCTQPSLIRRSSIPRFAASAIGAEPMNTVRATRRAAE